MKSSMKIRNSIQNLLVKDTHTHTHTHTHGHQHSMRAFSGQGKPLMHTNVSKSEDERWGQVKGVRCVYAIMRIFLALQRTGWICQWHMVHSSCCKSAVTQMALISDGWVTRMCNIVPVSFSMFVGAFMCKIPSINRTFVIYELYSSPNIIHEERDGQGMQHVWARGAYNLRERDYLDTWKT